MCGWLFDQLWKAREIALFSSVHETKSKAAKISLFSENLSRRRSQNVGWIAYVMPAPRPAVSFAYTGSCHVYEYGAWLYARHVSTKPDADGSATRAAAKLRRLMRVEHSNSGGSHGDVNEEECSSRPDLMLFWYDL